MSSIKFARYTLLTTYLNTLLTTYLNLYLLVDWQSVDRFTANCSNHLEYDTEDTVPFPAEWHMDRWSFGKPPEPIKVRVRDPVELMAYKLIDPAIMFKWSNHFHMRSFRTYSNGGSRVVSDLMSTDWARETEDLAFGHLLPPVGVERRDMFNHSAHHIIMPISLYTDGVAVGFNNHKSCQPILANCGNFSNELQRTDTAKCCVGFINDFSNFSKQAILKHLVDVNGYSKTFAINTYRYYLMEVTNYYWNKVLKPINDGFVNGYNMRILGKRGIFRVHPVVPYVIADYMDQTYLRHFYSNMSHSGCVVCTYPTRQPDVVYDKQIHVKKDMAMLNDLAIRGQNAYTKKRQGSQLSAVENRDLILCQEACVHPLPSPFLDSEFKMGSNNSMANYIPDLLHVFCGGIMKSCVQWIISIVMSFNSIPFFNGNLGELDGRISNFPDLPTILHINNSKFSTGVCKLLENTSKAEQTNATGAGGGGYRSLDFVSMLFQLYFAIGNEGRIVPSTVTYTYTFKNKETIEGKKKSFLNYLSF